MISQNLLCFPNLPVKRLQRPASRKSRQSVFSRRKAKYMQKAARQIVSRKLDLERLMANQSADEIISKFDVIQGIGVWTAELTMLRGMQMLDVYQLISWV